MGLKALLLGGTGETGKEVLKCLTSHSSFTNIVFVTRREVELSNQPKVVVRVVDFDNLGAHKDAFSGVDVAFCCLGTTRGKSGKDGFFKVDHDYVLGAAQVLKESESCKAFHLVSSKGASAESSFFYSATKGKVEKAVKDLAFERTSIYRPAILLTGQRAEARPLERMVQWVSNIFDRFRWISVQTDILAKVMVENAVDVNKVKGDGPYFEVLEQEDIIRMSKAAT